MFYFDKIENADILSDPYEHIVIEDVLSDTSTLSDVYKFLCNAKEWDQEWDMSLFRLPVTSSKLDKIQIAIDEYNWGPLMKRMGIEHYSEFVSSWQATKLSVPLGPHTDEPEITGVVAKILLYLTPDIDCGTIVHNSNLDKVKVTPGKLGDMFIFKTSTVSFHSTNYDHIDPNTKRVALVGCFHA